MVRSRCGILAGLEGMGRRKGKRRGRGRGGGLRGGGQEGSGEGGARAVVVVVMVVRWLADLAIRSAVWRRGLSSFVTVPLSGGPTDHRHPTDLHRKRPRQTGVVVLLLVLLLMGSAA